MMTARVKRHEPPPKRKLDLAPKNDLLFCQRKQLEVGDVILRFTSGKHVVTENDPLLQPDNMQGYFRYYLIGGRKWELFQADHEQVAVWSPMAGRWHVRRDVFVNVSEAR